MFSYRTAALVSVLVGLLEIPLLFFAIGAGVLEGLFDSRRPGLPFNVLAAPSYLLTIYVYLALHRYLRPSGIVWPVVVLLLLCVLGIVLSLLDSVAGLPEATSLVMHAVTLVPYGLALLALSIRLLQTRARDPSVQPLYGFAVCSLLTASLSLTVVLAPLAYAPAVLGSFLLAGAFFRIARGPRASAGENAAATLKLPGLAVVVAVSVSLLALLTVEFSHLYEVAWQPPLPPVLLQSFIVGLAALQAFVLGGLLRRHHAEESIAGSLNWVAVALGVWLCWLTASQSLSAPPDSGLVGMLIHVAMGKGIEAVFSVTVGAAWLYVAITVTWEDAPLNGYRTPLFAASAVTAAGYLLVFPDTLRLLGWAALCVFTMGLAFSSATPPSKALLVLDRRAQMALIALTLLLPGAAYVAFHAHQARGLHAAGISLAQLLSTERTAMQRVPEEMDHSTFVPPQASLVSATPIFDDVWFIDDQRGYAVDADYLYYRESDGNAWQTLRPLPTSGNVLRFDQDGQRGWVGPPWGPVQITEDGGRTWRTMDPEQVFREHTGREFGDDLTDRQSLLHLDPQHGRGAFVMGCRHFRTEDFGKTWRMSTFTRRNGKRLCVAESPFALNRTSTAVVGVILGEEVFYRREAENEPWEAVCAMDDGALFLLPTKACADDDTLSANEEQLLANHENEWAALRLEAPPRDMTHAILHGHKPTEDSLQGIARQNPFRTWLVDRGTLLRKDTHADQWVVEAHIPDLVTVIPLSDTRAFGWDLAMHLYTSENSGGVWRPLLIKEMADDYVIQAQPDPAMRGIWALASKGLYFVPFGAGKARQHLRAADMEAFVMFGTSPAGQTIWVYAEEQDRLHVSLNGGEDFQALDLTPHISETGDDNPLAHAVCVDSAQCYLVFDDGTLSEMTDQRVRQPVGALPAEVSAVGGHLMADAHGNTLLFVEEWGSQAYRTVDRGQNWERLPLGAEDYWSTPRRFKGPGSYILPGEDKVVLLEGLNADWTTINPWDWDEDMHYCWDEKTGALYLFNDENLAVSFDLGASWRRNKQRLSNPPFCGINHGFLWLNHRHMTIYRLMDSRKALERASAAEH
ncbi:MAG: hypothetical protein QNJ82_00420 [Gammaproteobacteria bacterium]|nr:hypothetical protein [Gammaproteobacteria bacterium]